MSKKILIGFFVLVLLLSAAGCGPKKEEPPKTEDGASSETGQSGEITIWAWSESEITGLAEKFNESYPDIKVKFMAVESDNYLAKLQNALVTGGEVADVILQEIDIRGPMFEMDIWENLEAEPYNLDRNIFFPQVLPTMMNPQGEIVGIERELNPSGLCYKRPLALKYFGTDDPYELGALIADWEKMITEGERIAQETGGEIKVFPDIRDAEVILSSQYVDPIFDGDKAYLTNYFEKNFGLIIRMHQAKMLGNNLRWSSAWNNTYVNPDNYILYPCAPWSPVWVVKANDPDGAGGPWGITTAPEKGVSFGGTAYGILKNAKNKDLAWTFIKWATTTDEGTKAAEEVVGAIVSRKANYENGFPENPDPFFGGQSVNKFLMDNALPTMAIRYPNKFDVVLRDVSSFVIDELLNQPDMTLDELINIALTEMKNKLPPEITIE